MGAVLFLCLGWQIEQRKITKIIHDVALDGRQIYTQQLTKNTWARQRRDKIGCKTRDFIVLGAIELGVEKN
jgi:hypothetical protein